jgi:hypothetical protein
MKKRKPSEHFQHAVDETTAAGLELSGSVLASIIVASAIERAAHIVADAIDRASEKPIPPAGGWSDGP